MYGRISDPGMEHFPPRVAWFCEPQVGVSNPSGAILIRGITVFILSLLELYMCGGISDPVMDHYPSRVALALRIPANLQSVTGVRISTPCEAVSIRGTAVFVPGLSELWMYGRTHDPGMGPRPPRVALGL